MNLLDVTYLIFVLTCMGGAILFFGFVWGGKSFSSRVVKIHIFMATVTLVFFTISVAKFAG